MKKLRIYIIPLLITISIIALALILPSDNLSLFKDPIYQLTGDFEVVFPDGSVENTPLPAKYSVDANEEIIISKTFDHDFPDRMSLRIRSSMQYMKIYVDEELIFENEKIDYNLLHAPEASVWYIVQLPSQVKGKTLKMTISSPVKAFSGLINPIIYGESGNLRLELISKRLGLLISSLILLFFGIIMLIMFIILGKQLDNRLYYLSLFTISTNLWLLSEMDLFQFFTGNRFIVGGISFMLLTVIPVYLIKYLKEVVLTRYGKLLSAISFVYLVLFAVNLTLQLGGISFFMDLQVVVNAFILVSIVIVIVLLSYDARHHKDKNSIKYLKYLSFFLATVVIELLMFFIGDFNSISSLSSIGFIVFLTLLIMDSIKYLNEIIAKENESKLLRKLAFMDILTKGPNRTSFERDVDNILNSDIKRSFRLVSADLNNLKLINDNYGHKEGDYAITSCYQCLKKGSRDMGQCYRLGGDEFACIIYDVDYGFYKEFVNIVEECIADISIDKPYELELAMGTGIYTNNDKETFEEFLHKVDLQMYENKRLRKTSQ